MDSISLKELQEKCKKLSIKGYTNKKKEELINILFEHHKNSGFSPKEFSNKTYNKIFHTADIHIRPIERHDEYMKVFIKFIRKLSEEKELNSCLLVICGDVFDHKTNITTNMLLMARNLFRTLAKKIDMVVIPGNHDIANTSGKRIDTITAILDGLSDNIYYFKDSNIYYCQNIVFTCDSFLDNKNIYYDSIPHELLNKRTTIHLYHGIVEGCGVPSESLPKKISDFDGFDMVLLGDIHKRQTIKPSNPYISYPGSLIQQNFAEDLIKGYNIYDLKLGIKSFVQINNEYGFYTFEIGKDKDLKILEGTQNIYLRIIVPSKSLPDEVDKITKELKSKFNVVKLKYKYLEEQQDIKEEDTNDLEKKINSDDLELLIEEMKILSIDEKKSEKIISLHKEMKNKFTTDELFYQDWKLYRLEFNNTLNYAGPKTNVIEFNDGIILLNGENASGKSSIISIIKHVLFDQYNLMFICCNTSNIKKYLIKAYVKIGVDNYTILREGHISDNIKKK